MTGLSPGCAARPTVPGATLASMKLLRIRTLILVPLALFALVYLASVVSFRLDRRTVPPVAALPAVSEVVAIFGASGTAGDGILKAALAHEGPAVVIARGPCVLLPEEKSKERTTYWVDEEACIQCDYCYESGCPALVRRGDYPWIRDWECIGCDICAQLCPVDAILQTDPATETAGREG